LSHGDQVHNTMFREYYFFFSFIITRPFCTLAQNRCTSRAPLLFQEDLRLPKTANPAHVVSLYMFVCQTPELQDINALKLKEKKKRKIKDSCRQQVTIQTNASPSITYPITPKPRNQNPQSLDSSPPSRWHEDGSLRSQDYSTDSHKPRVGCRESQPPHTPSHPGQPAHAR